MKTVRPFSIETSNNSNNSKGNNNSDNKSGNNRKNTNTRAQKKKLSKANPELDSTFALKRDQRES